MSFIVKMAKGQSILVDRGRRYAQAAGLSQGGALDEYSYLWANRLLGNAANAAALEVTLGPVTLTATASTTIAITGAQIPVKINQQTIPPWSSVAVKAGDKITVGFFQGKGTRLYIAVKGGFEAPDFFTSKSCVIREQLGGHAYGAPLATGHELCFTASVPLPHRTAPQSLRKLPTAKQAIRFIPSYQFSSFAPSQREHFCNTTYQLSPQMDRMGFRLQGESIAVPSTTMSSEGIALGSIQLDAHGQPIVLLSDRQNIGGYPKIGVVYRVDIGLLAQCAPGHSVLFTQGNLEEAWLLQQQRENFFET